MNKRTYSEVQAECPVQRNARQALACAQKLNLSLSRLSWSLASCDECESVDVCLIRDAVISSIATAICEVTEEWNLAG